MACLDHPKMKSFLAFKASVVMPTTSDSFSILTIFACYLWKETLSLIRHDGAFSFPCLECEQELLKFTWSNSLSCTKVFAVSVIGSMLIDTAKSRT